MFNKFQSTSKSFSLLEIMAVVAIIAILAVAGAPAYRNYTISASIAALSASADKVKNEVEDAHNQGTVFGTSASQTYIASTATDKPYALLDVIRGNYGCVNVDVDLSVLKLDTTKQLTMTWCPYIDNGSIEWKCGYPSTTYSGYVTYLPANCQQTVTSIQDTAF